jgi:hypothetical protein
MVRFAGALVPLLVLVAPAPALAAGTEAPGFAEVRAAVSPGASGRLWQLVERVRPTFASELTARVKLVATVEAGLVQGRDPSGELERTLRASELGPLLEQAMCRWPQHANAPLRVDDAHDYLDVDRLYLDVYAGALDLRLGRQALNWGSAQFFNPTDPFPEVLLAEPWRPRRGVNAARVNLPLGESRDLSAVAAVNDALDQMRAAARARQRWAGTDIALVGAWRGDSRTGLLGLDLRGTLGVGWWIEGAYLLGRGRHEEVATGIDYSWPVLERLLVFAEYYRNGAGQTDPAAYGPRGGLRAVAGPTCGGGLLPPFTVTPAGSSDPFAPFTAARNYLLLGGALAISPELNANFGFLQNLDDGSAVAIPTATWALRDWLELAFSAQVPLAVWGHGEFKPRPEDLQLQVPVPGAPVAVDLSGLVPAAVFTFWTRVSY